MGFDLVLSGSPRGCQDTLHDLVPADGINATLGHVQVSERSVIQVFGLDSAGDLCEVI